MKPGLSLQRRRELAAEIAAARETLLDAAIELANAYPKRNEASRWLYRAAELASETAAGLEFKTSWPR